MDWLFLLLGSICFVEIFIRLKTLSQIRSLNEIVLRITTVIRSPRISDHWKERVLPSYAFALLKQSLLIFILLLACFSIFVVLGLLSDSLKGHFFALTTSPAGLAASSCGALVYAALRQTQAKKTEGYSAGSKLLHQIALGSPFVGEALFDLEKTLYRSRTPQVSHKPHVFVSGLARAGTTILMRKLYETGQFRSLTYRDMPFVLAPNLWGTVTRRSVKKQAQQERAHGDGLMVNYDSPEALEEVFWRSFCGPAYIKSNCLVTMSADEDVIADFQTYISLIMKDSHGKRYLSKNNNNILRLHSLVSAFPDAIILIPFRDPLQQAYSLLRQHRHFGEVHMTDPFVKKYMTWLAHHEFGADHRPFQFDDEVALSGNPSDLEYWLRVWVGVYGYIINHLPAQALLVCYETLCTENSDVWPSLAKKIDVESNREGLAFARTVHHISLSVPVELLEKAHELYNRLCSRAIGNHADCSSS